MFGALQHPARAPQAGVTELVLAQYNPLQSAMMLPMLAHLSRKADERWITWVVPLGGTPDLTRESLEEYGFDLGRLRLVHTKDANETLWVLWQALAQGNSEAVIASPGKLSDRDFGKLEQAAYKGGCQGLLIRYR